MSFIETETRGTGDPYEHVDPSDGQVKPGAPRLAANRRWRIGVNFIAAAALAASSVGVGSITYQNDEYQENLQMIRSQTVRNDDYDNSDYRDWKEEEIVPTNHYGLNDRSDYVAFGTNPNRASGHFPLVNGGQFRTGCEFSHFAYDDPILFPDQPGKAHLHTFFGNTDANAHTTQDTLENSGSSTCNGQELNRSGYWVPTMFDGDGNVRVPNDISIYYKGEIFNNSGRFPTDQTGNVNPGSQIFERGMRNISPNPITIPEIPSGQGGATGEVNWKCTDNFSSPTNAIETVQNIPACLGNAATACGSSAANYPNCHKVLEMEVKFWNCYPFYDESDPNAAGNPDVSDWSLWGPPDGGNWYQSDCTNGFIQAGPYLRQEMYPHFRYFVEYNLEIGDDTSDWFLSADIDPSTIGTANPSIIPDGPGGAHHGDAWFSWDDATLQMALDNCINFTNSPTASGCAEGFLTDGGPDSANPLPGPSLNLRTQFDTAPNPSVIKVPASQIFAELCQPLGPSHSFAIDRHAAYCKP